MQQEMQALGALCLAVIELLVERVGEGPAPDCFSLAGAGIFSRQHRDLGHAHDPLLVQIRFM